MRCRQRSTPRNRMTPARNRSGSWPSRVRPTRPMQWMGLAEFYADRKNFPAMQQAIQSGLAADPGNGPALVQGATLLIEKHQDLAQQNRCCDISGLPAAIGRCARISGAGSTRQAAGGERRPGGSGKGIRRGERARQPYEPAQQAPRG